MAATPDDLLVARLRDCEVAAVLDAGLGLSRLDADTLRSTTGFYVVAWAGGVPLGHAHLARTDPPEMQDVLVAARARGRGVGRALVEALSREAHVLGADRLRLTVSQHNATARAVYERLGFVDAGLAPHRVYGTVQIRSGPIEVDDTLLTLERSV
jgi:GNAT superfamily N-acetyltransferase